MWYPEILNQMSRFVELHPNSEVSFCKAIDFYNMEQEHSNGTVSLFTIYDGINNRIVAIRTTKINRLILGINMQRLSG